MGEPGHFYKQCKLKSYLDQSIFSEGLDHQMKS